MEFEGYVELSFKVAENHPEYLEITVIDNGGGFSPEIQSEVYKNPVQSANYLHGSRYGEGTVYAAFYVQLMEGNIKGDNYNYADNLKGAKTSINIPVFRR
jgi:hypothetical protein